MKPIHQSALSRPVFRAWRLPASADAGRTCIAVSVCVALLAGLAQAQQAPTAAPASSNHPTNAPVFKDEKAKLSYAFGVNAASQLLRRSVEVDPDLYFQGFKAQLAGDQALLSAAEASATVGRFQRDLAKKGKEKAEEKARDTKQRGEKNMQEGAAFLAENKTKEGVVALPSGLQYKILQAGDGKRPTMNDTVVCNYRGTLLDGTEFSSTAKRGQPATLPVNKLMKGWREALQLMPVGSKWQVVVPPSLAYGQRSAGSVVGPNATLIFELELLAIKEKAVASAKDQSGGDESSGMKAEPEPDAEQTELSQKANSEQVQE